MAKQTKINKTLGIEKIDSFVEEVMLYAFYNGEFDPILMDTAIAKNAIEYLTNLPLPKHKDAESGKEVIDYAGCYDLFYNTDLRTRVEQESMIFMKIYEYITEKVDFKKRLQIVEEKVQRELELVDLFFKELEAQAKSIPEVLELATYLEGRDDEILKEKSEEVTKETSEVLEDVPDVPVMLDEKKFNLIEEMKKDIGDK